MKSLWTVCLALAFIVGACESESPKYEAPPAPAVQPPPPAPVEPLLPPEEEIPTEADFEEEADAEISSDNYEKELDELEKEIAEDS